MPVFIALSDAAAIGSAAGAAVLGAAAGGWATYRATGKLEQERWERQDEREERATLRQVRALAKVEWERYASATAVARTLLQHDCWLPLPHPDALAPRPPEHRVLLADYLPDEAWFEVMEGETRLLLLATSIAYQSGDFDGTDRQHVDEARQAIERARDIFAELVTQLI